MRNLKSHELLKVSRLTVHFRTYQGVVRAIESVEFDMRRYEIVGLIGETGCGKTVTSYAILRLIRPPGYIVQGQIIFKERNLLELSEKEVRRVRGKEIAMIFQRPMSSLNPVFSIGTQLLDVIGLHRSPREKEARDIAIRSLSEVALPDPEGIMGKRPFELSGGMQQRVMIAMALACETSLLIADEPTTALDVSIQLQILKLMRGLADSGKITILLISHDMSVIGSMCNRINVMYAGTIVESGPKDAVIDHPVHPYTKALLQAVPEMSWSREDRLRAIDGTVPSLIGQFEGCRFAPRCPVKLDICTRTHPRRAAVGLDHYVNCHQVNQEKVKEGVSTTLSLAE